MESEIVIVKFLTPYKVSIIATILLYCDGIVPPRNKMKLMCRLVNFIDPQQSATSSIQPEIQLLDRDLRQLESFMASLHSRVPGLSLFDFLIDFLFRMTSLDSLHTFMGRINEYLVRDDPEKEETEEGLPVMGQIGGNAVLRQSSLLGSFCKRCFLAFDSLSFDAVLHLWEYIETFREPYRAHWEKIHKRMEALKMDGLELTTFGVDGLREEILSRERAADESDDGGDDDGDSPDFLKSLIPKPPPVHCIAAENLETLLEFQISVFERYGGTLPDEIRYVLQSMIATNKPLPTSAHYVQYLDAFRDKDYEAAFDHLHRFYDYTMNSRGRTHYQYALFTLATLQAEFGFYSEAMEAVDEAITVARENKDNHCLNYILSWLYSFLQSHRDCKPPASLSSLEQISQFLRIRAKETSFSLYSLSYQSEVEQLVPSGGSLTQAFESLIKSKYINAISNSAFAAGNLSLVASGLWMRCGSAALAHLALDLYSWIPERKLNALLTIEMGVRKAKLYFLQGRLPECFDLLRSLKHIAHGSQWHQQLWHPKFLMLHLARRLNEGKLQEAKYLFQKLSGVAAVDTEIAHDIYYYQRIWDIKYGNTSEALESMWTELEESERKGEGKPDLLYQVRLMVLYAKQLVYGSGIGLQCTGSHGLFSSQNEATMAAAGGDLGGLPPRAVTLVLRIIKIADTAALAQFACEGVILLAAISIAENEPADALALLDGILPRVCKTEKLFFFFSLKGLRTNRF